MIFTIDPIVVVQMVLSLFLPLAVALVTTRVTKSSVKAWLLATITLVTSVVTALAHALTTGTVFDLGVALLAAIPSFVIAVATYYGLWKPTGTAARIQDISVK